MSCIFHIKYSHNSASPLLTVFASCILTLHQLSLFPLPAVKAGQESNLTWSSCQVQSSPLVALSKSKDICLKYVSRETVSLFVPSETQCCSHSVFLEHLWLALPSIRKWASPSPPLPVCIFLITCWCSHCWCRLTDFCISNIFALFYFVWGKRSVWAFC